MLRKRLKLPSRQGRVFSWGGLAVWAALLAVTGTFTVRAELASMLRSTPELALRFDPGHADALVRLAATLQSGTDGDGVDVQGAQLAARMALRRDLLQPAAWRILGTSHTQTSADVVRRLEFAERLSRRDIPTQLALIEYTSSQGDLGATLRRYDTVMRISPAYDQVLFPILARALDNAIVLRAVSEKLPNVPWRRRFFSYLVEGGASYSRQADLFQAIAAQGSAADEDIIALQASRAAFDGQFDAALKLYRLFDPLGAESLVRNPHFAQHNGVVPFDWQLEVGGLLNVRVTGTGDESRLEMASVRGDGGLAARQLLYLAPGRYRFSGQTGPIDGYGGVPVSVNLSCADGRTISGFQIGADRPRSLGGAFTVPSACPVQWLAIAVGQEPNGGRSGAWISGLSLERAGG